MYLTLDDLKYIEKWLQNRTIKDSELPIAESIQNSDIIPIVQNGKNRQYKASELLTVIKDIADTSVENRKKLVKRITLEEYNGLSIKDPEILYVIV